MPTLKCGVYAIEHTASGRCYIGSSANIVSRWYGHRKQLNAGIHHSPFLQNAWTKYGPDAFRFYVLEECHRADLIDREQEYMEALHPVFNVCPTAGSRLGAKDSEQGLANVRKANAERVAKITHCPAGHEYTEANTGRNPKGKRYCRACAAERVRQNLAAETPEQREWRRLRAADYYARNQAKLNAQNVARQAAHKEEKRAYDAARAELKAERDRRRRAAMQADPKQRAAHLAQRRAARQMESPETRERRLAECRAYYGTHKAAHALALST